MMRRITGFIFNKGFEKSYAKQDKHIKDAFRERRNLLMIDPEHPMLNNHSLQGEWKGYRSINVTGDIRAIYKIEGFFAIFVEIGTHSQIYG